MRRLIALPLTFALLLLPSACRQRRKHTVTQSRAPQEETLTASVVSAGDARAAAQFSKGFYSIENNAWRWSAKDFTVTLAPPSTAQTGAQLELDFAVPDVIIQRLKSVTLTASIGGNKLAPEEYKTAGDHTYVRDVPAADLKAASIPVEFSLDKALPATATDSRELGVVVSRVGFKTK
jgi:hypothetical protein